MATKTKKNGKASKKSSVSNEMTLFLYKDKETKGAVRYSEESDDFPKNIYFRKEEMQETFGGYPASLCVVITRNEDADADSDD